MKRAATWIKICGTTSLHDAQLAIDAGASAVGFVFAAGPRRVDVQTAAEIVAGLNGEVETIGVFVNETPVRIAEVVDRAGLSGVQLHGEEDAEAIASVRQLLAQQKIVKAVRAEELHVEDYEGFAGGVDAVLLDSGSSQTRGGTGATFDWEQAAPIAARIREKMPLIIAGGLNAGNVAEAVALFEPWGVDVVSGVESEPGIKDGKKLQEFVAAVRQSG